MRRILFVTMLAGSGLGCSDDVGTEALGETEPASQLGDAARIDAAVVKADAALADARAPTDAASPARDAGTAGKVTPCKGADTRGTPAELHAAAATVLTAATPCGFSACHQGSRARAGLRLSGIMDLREQLVDRPTCEAPSLPLVASGGGEEGLAKSWLWIKLTSPVDAASALPNDEAHFGAYTNCGQSPSEPYGRLMPLGNGSLEESELAPIRNWICAGAPGPK